jgi:hypothetical protein
MLMQLRWVTASTAAVLAVTHRAVVLTTIHEPDPTSGQFMMSDSKALPITYLRIAWLQRPLGGFNLGQSAHLYGFVMLDLLARNGRTGYDEVDERREPRFSVRCPEWIVRERRVARPAPGPADVD